MDFLGLNLTDVNTDLNTDTINNLNEISLSPNSYDWRNDNQIGGFFWSQNAGVSNTKDVSEAALELAREKDFPTLVKGYIDKGIINNYAAKDENGNTILHYMISDPNHDINSIKKILEKTDAQSIINVQNNEGDTPLILAVKSGDNELSKYLVSKGADKNIKNNQGFHVDSETEIPENMKDNEDNISVQRCPLSVNNGTYMKRTSDIFITDSTNEDLDEVVKRLFQRSNSKSMVNQTSEPESLGTDTQNFASNLADRYQQPINVMNEDNTDELIKKIDQQTLNNHQVGGCGCHDASKNDDTLSNIKNFIKGSQVGGRSSSNRKTIKGLRRQNRNQEIDEDDMEENYNSRMNRGRQARNISRQDELSRLVENQAKEIHERVIKKILSLLSDNEKELGVEPTQDNAVAIKSIIWEQTKERNPSIKSNFDLSVEMEKLANLDTIKSIKKNQLKEKKEKIKQHYEEKANRRASLAKNKSKRRPRKQTDATISGTSSDEVSNRGSISETSMSD